MARFNCARKIWPLCCALLKKLEKCKILTPPFGVQKAPVSQTAFVPIGRFEFDMPTVEISRCP